MVLKDKREELQKRNFIEALRLTADIEASMRIVGVRENKLFEWIESDEDIAEQVIEIRKRALLKLENIAFQQALEGDKSQIQFLLKSHNPEVYNKSVTESNITNISLTKIEDNRVAGMPVQDAYDKMNDNAIRLLESMPEGRALVEHIKNKEQRHDARSDDLGYLRRYRERYLQSRRGRLCRLVFRRKS